MLALFELHDGNMFTEANSQRVELLLESLVLVLLTAVNDSTVTAFNKIHSIILPSLSL